MKADSPPHAVLTNSKRAVEPKDQSMAALNILALNWGSKPDPPALSVLTDRKAPKEQDLASFSGSEREVGERGSNKLVVLRGETGECSSRELRDLAAEARLALTSFKVESWQPTNEVFARRLNLRHAEGEPTIS